MFDWMSNVQLFNPNSSVKLEIKHKLILLSEFKRLMRQRIPLIAVETNLMKNVSCDFTLCVVRFLKLNGGLLVK